jgi:2-succinyl-6-hydroxy-2,4-cyclohexadiene-1-carboxylate synthase
MQVVALHGFANTEAQWDAVAAALPASIRLRTVAVPGHVNGAPVAPSWRENVEQLAQVVSPPGQPPAGLVIGYSLGARLTLGLVAAGHVEHAILVSVNPGLQLAAERAERRSLDDAWATLLRTQGIAAFARAWQAQALFDSQQQVSAELRSARTSQRLGHDPTQLAEALMSMGLAAMPDYRATIAAHQHRLHLVVGALDRKFVALAQQLTTAHPDLPCTEIPGCGHDPTLESPTEIAQLMASVATTIQGRSET